MCLIGASAILAVVRKVAMHDDHMTDYVCIIDVSFAYCTHKLSQRSKKVDMTVETFYRCPNVKDLLFHAQINGP